MSCEGFNTSRGCPCSFKGKFTVNDKQWCGIHKPHEVVECSICMEDVISRQEMKTLPCGHKFHSGCMDKWSNSSQNNSHLCPLCRQQWREYVPKLHSSDVEPIPMDEFEEDILLIDLTGVAELIIEMLM